MRPDHELREGLVGHGVHRILEHAEHIEALEDRVGQLDVLGQHGRLARPALQKDRDAALRRERHPLVASATAAGSVSAAHWRGSCLLSP